MILSTCLGSFLTIFRRFYWSFAGHVKPSKLMTLTRDLHGFSFCRRLNFQWFSVLFLNGFPTCFLTRRWAHLGYFFGPFGYYFRRIFLYVFACFFGWGFWWFWVPKGFKKGAQRRSQINQKSIQNQAWRRNPIWTSFGPDLGSIFKQFWNNSETFSDTKT